MNFQKTTLANGLRVITVPMKDNPSVTVFVMVSAGSRDEDRKNNGISHFLEHMVFKGTVHRPETGEIFHELESIGADYNAFTSQEYTGYYAKVSQNKIDVALDIVSDMYLNPLLDAKEMEKEKGVIVEEIKMYQDMPQAHVQDIFSRLVCGDTPAGWNVAGTIENVKSFTREDFVSYRSKMYVPSSTVVVVSGHFDEKDILKKVEQIFSALPEREKSERVKFIGSQTKPEIELSFKETDQTHLVLGVRSFDIFNSNTIILRVLSGILGGGMSSRLFKKLRTEMGVCYYVQSQNDPSTDYGIFSVSAGVDSTRVHEVVKVILQELKKLSSEIVSDEELKRVKDYIIGGTVLGLETSDAQAQYVCMQEILKGKIDSMEEYAAKINSVTKEDILKIAQSIFVSEGLNMALIGRFKDKKEFEDYFVL